MSTITPLIIKLHEKTDLSEDEMQTAMNFIMEGKADQMEIKNFLLALSKKGETVEEIAAAARIMREKSKSIDAPYDAVDCCGTGGDAQATYNISTAVSIVAAACGVPIVKHGNRASSSKSGAADVLETIGVNLEADLRNIAYAIKNIGYAFFMAPMYHPAMRYVSAARKEIAKRTIFNALGPLANPAKARYQLIGVYKKELVLPFAESLKRLGTKRARIVHGAEGLDEISISGKTYTALLDDEGNITEETLTPDSFGLPCHSIDKIIGGEATDNAKALRALLEGTKNAYRDIVLANTAAVLQLHNPDISLLEGVKLAAQSIDTGRAYQLLKDYIAITRLDPNEHDQIKDIQI